MTTQIKITHILEEAKLICKVKKFGGSGHIILPKIMIGKEVIVSYNKKEKKE